MSNLLKLSSSRIVFIQNVFRLIFLILQKFINSTIIIISIITIFIIYIS